MDSRFSWSTDYHHPTPWDQEFAPLSLPDMLAASVERRGDAPMLDFMGRQFGYAEVARGAARVARGLQQRGVAKGSRIGLFLPNVPHYVAAYYGALAIGATVVNFSPLYTVAELEAQVEDSGTEILFTISAAALLPTALKVLDGSSLQTLVVGSVAGGLPAAKSVLYRLFKRSEVAALPADPRVIRFSALTDNDGRPDPVTIDAAKDIALIQYTGGTTGTPKGAELTHQNLTANARQVNAIDPDHDADDRILGVLPFFHVFANTCVLNRTILNGGTITMLPRFDAKQALDAITRTKTTALPGVPTMYQALLDHPDLATTDFSSLRVCISGGAPMPAELREKFVAATGASLVEGYGLTESSGVVATNPYNGPVKPGTIGQPLPATHIRLLDKEDPAKDAPAGEPGELAVKGPQIMQGYWNRPDADKDSFTDDGWLRTGDVAVVEEGGYIRIVDRLKDMIAVGGFKVYPSVIEAHLYEHPAVKEAIVLGVPDAYRGEAPKAFVTLEDGFDVSGEALAAWLNPQLGKHERVKAVDVRLNLPKTMIGKLDRKALRAEEGG
ncbi:long-chain-fatty-acid--CoA ligase [Sphingopyxis sp. RIFCSPHIGHO2_12_FULL_65_19]|uniref:long-chain-fatty-acid--CoA ligase n=1 Tax=Sphingopyxis sp. RIFCSPHIGHO2_12_FULL_65_19 TaxID=1802172 RepID=UPI0008C49F21|nr:long-chain fatty acid--CoA ligase [Sphingopyxis sp. RIFCSPHIGHO2_12_FULL_65_19]OHD06576.1 MAG: dicarboxylate--CoA ligase PimA [Sphingopyxis sp. RIFCSPHIGHO2_12_FULL_65_19]